MIVGVLQIAKIIGEKERKRERKENNENINRRGNRIRKNRIDGKQLKGK